MRLSRLGLLLALSGSLALAVPVAAAENCYRKTDASGTPTGPQYCEQQVWFHQAATKVGNLGATGATPLPSWNTTAPKASATTGAGGGYASNGVHRQQQQTSDPSTGATFEGTFTGALDTLDVTMFMFAPGRQAEPTYHGGIQLTVDGKTVFDQDVDGLPLAPGGNAVLKTSFVLAGLTDLMKEAGVDTGEGVAHTVRFYFSAYPLVTQSAVFVYDATEAPSGMVFNTTRSLAGRFVLGGEPTEG